MIRLRLAIMPTIIPIRAPTKGTHHDMDRRMDRRGFVAGISVSGLLTTSAVARAVVPASRTGSGGVQDVRAHGALGDGTTPDDAAFQAAVDALPESGGTIHIPPGTYLRTGTTNTRGKPILFAGSGKGSTFLKVAHSHNDILLHSGTESCDFRDFTFFSTQQRTGGAYIKIDPGNGKIAYSSTIERVRTYGHYVGIDLVRCSDTRIRDCPMIGNAGSYACVLTRNLTNPDSGDNSISGCFFSGAGGAGVRQESSGGLRLTDNKFNGLVEGFVLSPQSDGRSTSILLIQGNSFENASKRGILLERGNGKSIFTYGIISNNEFGYSPVGIEIIAIGDTFYDFIISDNIFAVPDNGTGIIMNGGNTFSVKGNIFDGIKESGLAIKLTDSEKNPRVLDNIKRNIN